jgi:dTDP-4-dehydrorhamnose reductase
MDVLIIGGGGQVGSAVASRLDNNISVSRSEGDIQADITTTSIIDVIMDTSPDVIVHTAAYHRMDEVENNPQRSREVNVEGTQRIMKAAEKTDSHTIFLSTDNVYEGVAGFYSEDDNTNPTNVYGRHKLEAEGIVERGSVPTTILRTSLVFDEGHDNFFTWIQSHLEEADSVGIVTDQVCNPTYAGDLANIIKETARKGITGRFNTAGASVTSRYEAACVMDQEIGLNGQIQKVTRKDVDWEANRPPNTSLCLRKLLSNFNSTPRTLSQGIRAAFR